MRGTARRRWLRSRRGRAVAKKGIFSKGTAQSIDLDASAILFDASGRVLDTVWYGQLRSCDGSLRHTGDNLTGAGDGESINVDLSQVPAGVSTIVFTVNSFTGQGFSQVANAYVRLLDATNRDEEIASSPCPTRARTPRRSSRRRPVTAPAGR